MIRGLALLLWLPLAAGAQPVPEPEDYRMDHYRAPVPATLSGAAVVGPKAAYALWLGGETVFIDVMPQAPRPANLPEGTLWRDKPRYSIPGSIWLPNVGYGALAEITEQYFRDGLARATGGEKTHPILLFCLEDCWMSWNAAKRALDWGYTAVHWLPEGSDGWVLWDYPLERITPEEPQPQSN